MSFHWNLSSDDDDSDNDDDDEDTPTNNVKSANLQTTTRSFLSDINSGGAEHRNDHVTDNNNIDSHTLNDVQPPTDWYRNGDTPHNGYNNDNKDEDEDEDEDEVDWEDAEKSDDDDDDRKPAAKDTSPPKTTPPAVTLRSITIDLDQSNNATVDSIGDATAKSSKKRKRRNVFRMETLPNNMQSLLQNLHYTHVLSLAGHAVYISNVCSNAEIMALAYSLIPDHWDIQSVPQHHVSSFASSKTVTTSHHQNISYNPSLQQMRQFVNEWYLPLVHDIEQRRRQQQYGNRRAGAPTIRIRRSSSGRGSSRSNHKGKATKLIDDDEPNIDTNDP